MITLEQIGWDILSKLISLLILAAVYFLFQNVIFKKMRKSYQKLNQAKAFVDQRADTLYKLFESCAHYVLYFLTAYIALSILGVPIATLVAGAGIAGLVIGLGAQGFINDLINGVFILIERQYDVGDYVIIANIEGRIKAIGLRLTTIQTVDGSTAFIRNNIITSVNNLSRSDRRGVVQLFIKEATDTLAMDQLIHQLTETYNKTASNHKLEASGFNTSPNGSLYYSVYFYAPYEEISTLQSHYYQRYFKDLEAAGIKVF